MPSWSFMLDLAGVPQVELQTGQGRNIVYTRNGYPEAHITISHDDTAASILFAALANGIPRLRAYRDGDLVFHGDLAPFDEQLEETKLLNLTFRGPFAKLIGYGQDRGRFTAATFARTNRDAGLIAKDLIDTYGSTAGIDTTGTIQATKIRDRTYQYANVGQEIVNLTQVLDGFDFEVVSIEYAGGNIGLFVVYAQQGSDRSDTVRFQYGPSTIANVRAVTRQIEPPINTARVIGANGVSITRTDAASIARYGEYWVQISASDVIEQATLIDKAQALLRPDPIRVISFSPDPTLAPAPWDDFWIGDTVSFFGRDGGFQEETTVRINKITVVIDDEGNEAYEVEQPGSDGNVITGGVEVEVTGPPAPSVVARLLTADPRAR